MECYFPSPSVTPSNKSDCSFMSIVILPRALDAPGSQCNCLEDTLARANAWLNCSQATGVPILFLNVQAESLVIKISREGVSRKVMSAFSHASELSTLANVSLYGIEDYHGVDVGAVKAVRLWYTPAAGERSLEIKLQEADARLGFSVSRTEEGFLYISSIADDDDGADTPANRSGLSDLYKEANEASKLLVVSRIAEEKVLPWLVSPSGAIRCFDTVSLSRKLSLHRHALHPVSLHFLMWDTTHKPSPTTTATRGGAPPPPMASKPEANVAGGRDAAGEYPSFRFGVIP